jgi:hypothetical protein
MLLLQQIDFQNPVNAEGAVFAPRQAEGLEEPKNKPAASLFASA